MTEHTEARSKLADARRVHHYAELAAQAQARPSELAVDPSWRRFGYTAPEADAPAEAEAEVSGLDLWREHTGVGYAPEADQA